MLLCLGPRTSSCLLLQGASVRRGIAESQQRLAIWPI